MIIVKLQKTFVWLSKLSASISLSSVTRTSRPIKMYTSCSQTFCHLSFWSLLPNVSFHYIALIYENIGNVNCMFLFLHSFSTHKKKHMSLLVYWLWTWEKDDAFDLTDMFDKHHLFFLSCTCVSFCFLNLNLDFFFFLNNQMNQTHWSHTWSSV